MMRRVAQKGTTIVAVDVIEQTAKAIRSGAAQYNAVRVDNGNLFLGGGDSIEEAVDDLSRQL